MSVHKTKRKKQLNNRKKKLYRIHLVIYTILLDKNLSFILIKNINIIF